jgi:xanthine dehydrogenase YagS FAD-binding subunit
VALKPWRKVEAEKVLVGQPAGAESFGKAAEILLAGAKGYEHNSFKIEMAKQGVVRALTLASMGTSEAMG